MQVLLIGRRCGFSGSRTQPRGNNALGQHDCTPACETVLWHDLLLQVAFAQEAMGDKALMRNFRKHALIGGFGLGCFMLEDLAIARGHSFVHSLWHLHSCYAVASANALMERRERAKLESDPEFSNGTQFVAA